MWPNKCICVDSALSESIFNDAAIYGVTGAAAAAHWLTEKFETNKLKITSGDLVIKLTLLKMITIEKQPHFMAESTSSTKTVSISSSA